MASEQEVARFEEFFRAADADGSGSLTFCELCGILRSRGYKGSDADLKNYFTSCDTSNDGLVTMEEYKVAMGLMSPEQHKAAAFRSVFNAFDKDGSGSIDKSELQAVFAEMGKMYSEEEVGRLIKLADQDGNDTLEYEEFIKKVFGQ